jgi:hypothetical protein
VKRFRFREKAKVVDAARLDERLGDDLDEMDLSLMKKPRADRQARRTDWTKPRKGRSR